MSDPGTRVTGESFYWDDVDGHDVRIDVTEWNEAGPTYDVTVDGNMLTMDDSLTQRPSHETIRKLIELDGM